jgi:glycosyltransferase involved in cell wall biosynthesis
MSSGLVPITSDLPVVREFLTEEEGYIAPYEDAAGLADAIRDLYHHPDVFLAKSRAAAARVRRTVASAVVIPQELALFIAEPAARKEEGEAR